jgi:hypothetical protein
MIQIKMSWLIVGIKYLNHYWNKTILRLTNGIRFGGGKRRLGLRKTAVGLFALCAVLSPPHLGQGSMLRIALLPAPNDSYLERYVQVF